MWKKILNTRSKTVAFSAFLLAISGVISRLLGLLRDRLLAGQFGAGPELDIYFAAFRIPDFVYTVLITGGITAAFLPVFSEYFNKKGDEWSQDAVEFTNNLLNSIAVVLVLICTFLAIFAPIIVNSIVPGFSESQKALAVILTRIMFLSPILFGIASILSGILQYFEKFLIYSLCPILYNIGIIIGILFFVPIFGVYGLALGVVLGALMYLLIQVPVVFHSGFKYKPIFNFRHHGIRKIFSLTIPRIIGTATDQINMVIVTAIASMLSSGSIAVFSFATNLQYFPIGIIGISFAVSSFPAFSKNLANGDKKEFLKSFSSSFRQILFLIIPISFIFFLLRSQAVRLALGTGKFNWEDTRLTSAAVGLLCFGVLANSLIPLIVRAFFALKNTKTPVAIAIFTTIVSIILSYAFVNYLGFDNFLKNTLSSFLVLNDLEDIKIIGLPLALSTAVSIQLILLLFFLYKEIGDFRIKEILTSLGKIVIATIAMFVVAYFVRQGTAVEMQTFKGVLIQSIMTLFASAFCYIAVSVLLKSPELQAVKRAIFKK